MNSRIFIHLYDWSGYAIGAITVLSLCYFLTQTCFFYFTDLSYQTVILGPMWQTAFKEQCRTVPGCLDIKFESNFKWPSKSASSLQLIGTHVDAQLSVTSGTPVSYTHL